MKFFTFYTDNNEPVKRSFNYISKTRIIYYTDSKLQKHKIKHEKYRFIKDKSELNNLFIPNLLYIFRLEDENLCSIYIYDEDIKGIREISKQKEIIKIINSVDPIQVSTLRGNTGEEIYPVTTTKLVNTMDGVTNVDRISRDNIGKNIGKYETAVRYLEILNPVVRIYSIPAPIPNLTIKETSVFLLFVGDEQITPDKYTILDNDYQIEFNENMVLTAGMQIMFIMSFHRAVDLENIKISHSNLTDEMGIEWENAQRHLRDFNNPHRVYKNQVGLGNVQNFPIASTSEANEGVSDTVYMTPLKTAELVKNLIAEGYVEYGSYIIRKVEWNYRYVGTTTTSYEIPSDYYDPMTEELSIFMFGLRLELGTDYNISGRTVTLLVKIEDGAILNHIIKKVVPNEVDKTPVYILKNTIQWTSTESNQDSFAIPPSQFTSSCRVELYLEGVRMNEDSHYTITDNIIELVEPVAVGMTIYVYIFETNLDWSSIHNRPKAIDNLNSDSTVDYLTARQGKILSQRLVRNMDSYRISGNREVETIDGDNKTIEFYDSNDILIAREVTISGNNEIVVQSMFVDQITRDIEEYTVKITKDGNKTIKEYL